MPFMWCAPHRWSFEPAGPHPIPHSCVAICVVCGTQIAFRRSYLQNLLNTMQTICTVLTTQMEPRPHHFADHMLPFAWRAPRISHFGGKSVKKWRSRCMRSVRCSPGRWSFQPAGTHRFRQTWAAICVVHTTQIAFRAQWPERRADKNWKCVLWCTPRRSLQKDTLAPAPTRQRPAPNRDLEIAKPQRKGFVYS